jgi:hypothetical protein
MSITSCRYKRDKLVFIMKLIVLVLAVIMCTLLIFAIKV